MPAATPTDEALIPLPGDHEAVTALLDSADPATPPLESPDAGVTRWIPVRDAELRVIHITPRNPVAARPVVFVPGWGTNPVGWQDFLPALWGKAELYYVETREKTSSRIHDRRTDMSVAQSARDIGEVLRGLGLADRDHLLVGACWGGAMILRGLIDGSIRSPTVLLADPMHTLWFPKWVLRWVAPWIPTLAVTLLRPFIAAALLGDMREPTQKARAYAFVYGADIWKWKKSAVAAAEFELYDELDRVTSEVFVLNGTADKVHDPADYPRMARQMRRARFLFMPTDESRRELLVGAASMEMARVGAAAGLPPSLTRFERPLRG